MEVALNALKIGQKATVLSVNAKETILRRLLDIGIVPGTRVRCVLKSPLGDPVAYLIRGSVIALRREDSEKIIVKINPYLQGSENNGTDFAIGRETGAR